MWWPQGIQPYVKHMACFKNLCLVKNCFKGIAVQCTVKNIECQKKTNLDFSSSSAYWLTDLRQCISSYRSLNFLKNRMKIIIILTFSEEHYEDLMRQFTQKRYKKLVERKLCQFILCSPFHLSRLKKESSLQPIVSLTCLGISLHPKEFPLM